jgi:hypothetical protein
MPAATMPKPANSGLVEVADSAVKIVPPGQHE